MMITCPSCGNKKFIRNPEGFLVCSNCGLVVKDSNIVYDSYHNHVFLDEWNARAKKLKAFSHIGIPSSEPSISATAKLIQQHLIEILRDKKYRNLIGVVQNYSDTGSIKKLFKSFLDISGLNYREARKLFIRACVKAGLNRIPDLAPSTFYTYSYSRKRLSSRQVKIEREYEKIREMYGEDIEKLTRSLSELPAFQPADPLALGLAIAIYVNRASLKDSEKLGVSRRRVKLKLERVKIIADLPLPLLARIDGSIILRNIKLKSYRTARTKSYSSRRALKIETLQKSTDLYEKILDILREPMFPWELKKKLGIKTSYYRVLLHRLKKKGLVKRLDDGRYIALQKSTEPKREKIKIVYDSFELVKYYKTYGGYVKACKKLMDQHFQRIKPLSYEEWLQEKFIQKLLEKIEDKRLEELEIIPTQTR
ncbi:MAG: hypothetical protein J7K23_07980 [Thermoproteales archaeon]|nr:hypothetical protein [Thermoproteales archaeon]